MQHKAVACILHGRINDFISTKSITHTRIGFSPVSASQQIDEVLHTVNVTVNGKASSSLVPARLTLADFLREKLGLTGTHLGCEHGVCGACTVLVDEQPVRACLMFAVQVHEHTVTTIEGLSQPGQLSELQQCFRSHHALQCGFCTPGMVVTATALLRECPRPDAETVREALSGNICRCTGYIPIVQAVVEAGERLAASIHQ